MRKTLETSVLFATKTDVCTQKTSEKAKRAYIIIEQQSTERNRIGKTYRE